MHNSYHDVVIAANNRLYELFNLPFSVRLMATRTGGWELWNTANDRNGNKDEKIAEEFGRAPMTLYVKHDDKELKPTIFCHHNWRTPQEDAMLMSANEIVIGNMTADAKYLGAGNLEITTYPDLLLLLRDYVAFTESIFFDGLLWEVQSFTSHTETMVLQIANPKYNKDL
jgi:hypothetical protein